MTVPIETSNNVFLQTRDKHLMEDSIREERLFTYLAKCLWKDTYISCIM